MRSGLKFLFHTDGHYGAALPIIMETLERRRPASH